MVERQNKRARSWKAEFPKTRWAFHSVSKTSNLWQRLNEWELLYNVLFNVCVCVCVGTKKEEKKHPKKILRSTMKDTERWSLWCQGWPGVLTFTLTFTTAAVNCNICESHLSAFFNVVHAHTNTHTHTCAHCDQDKGNHDESGTSYKSAFNPLTKGKTLWHQTWP